MRTLLYRAALAPILLLITLPVQAATWVLDPEQSSVIFEYTFGGDPYEGEFKNVEAIFNIDPMNPAACDLHDYELFDVDQWPTASFKADSCSLKSLSSFVSEGTLTIRDQTNPMSFPFNLDVDMEGGKLSFHLTSEVTINRLEYGVGQGYWAGTGEIPNEVTIKVDVRAVSQ
jgi:polyisoprenoid-binding protein YceI